MSFPVMQAYESVACVQRNAGCHCLARPAVAPGDPSLPANDQFRCHQSLLRLNPILVRTHVYRKVRLSNRTSELTCRVEKVAKN